MEKRLICLIFLTLFVGLNFAVLSQSFNLTGKILDKETQAPLPDVFVNVTNINNARESFTVASDKNGYFFFSDLKIHTKYKLKASLMGFSDLEMPVESKNKTVNLGTLLLSVKSQPIGEVIVKGNPPSAVQKGDTVEMNAGAFTTNPDASAEDLVTKMPGITVENNTVKAQGEEVKKVLVDGKDFFGEDPSVALKNLPADIIDKIQVFDKLSEQAQFTGFDDGNSAKTINIITKKEKQNGQFGKFYAGTDFDSKYIAGGNLNLFNKQRRISVIGLINNINQQNFAQQDLLGIPGSISTVKQNGFVVGVQNGINTTRSVGFNYSDDWGSKVNVTGSYFLNETQNYTTQQQLKDKFLSPKPDHYSDEFDTSSANRYNHRIHMRIEYDIDSMNTLISTPKLTFQTNNSDKFMSKTTVNKVKNDTVNFAWAKNKLDMYGYNIENELVFRHKLNKPRRTFSIAITTTAIHRDPNSTQVGLLHTSTTDSVPTNQYNDGDTHSYKILSNMEYNEPISTSSFLRFNLTNAYTDSRKEREAYDINNNMIILDHVDSLSNIYKTYYFNNHIGVDYRLKKENLKFSIGAEYQLAYLTGDELFPVSSKVKKNPFENILPNFLINIKNPNSSLRILYKTSTNAPSISQMQNVIDNGDRTSINTGNPYLTQEYSHNLTCTYSFANPENSINYLFYLNGEYALNYIGSQTIVPDNNNDTIKDLNIILSKGLQLTRPLNFDHFTNIRALFDYSFPVKWIMSKINLTTGISYTQTPGLINENLNWYSLYSTTDGITISSDISENIDFSISYTLNYSIIKNSIAMSIINSNNNPKYLYQTTGAKFNCIFWNGFVLETDALFQLDKGFQNFNQHYILWDASLAKKIFKDQKGEIKISTFDILDQNSNITHTVTPQYIQDSKINALHRYYMLTFTYTLKDFPGYETHKKSKKEGHKKKDSQPD